MNVVVGGWWAGRVNMVGRRGAVPVASPFCVSFMTAAVVTGRGFMVMSGGTMTPLTSPQNPLPHPCVLLSF